jgi:inosine-uridine nucleoside N-ribohydrolase
MMCLPNERRALTTSSLRPFAVVLASLLLPVGGCGRPLPSNRQRIPVILDTDIGGDIDDAWALSLLLASPEVDVKLVVSDSHKTGEKARLISEFLKRANRQDIPIGIGVRSAGQEAGKEAWAAAYSGTVREDGVQAIIDTIMKSDKPMTLLAIGPVPNLAQALDREPRIVNNARLVVMGGSIGRQEQGEPGFAESNVVNDIQAAQKAYGAGWDVTMAPTDTAGKVQLEGDDYARVRDAENPVARLLMDQYRLWNSRQTKHARDISRTSSTLWDTVAVYLVFDRSFCRMRDIKLRVTDEGITQPTADGKLTHVAMEWENLGAFHRLIADRISGFRPRALVPASGHGPRPLGVSP